MATITLGFTAFAPILKARIGFHIGGFSPAVQIRLRNIYSYRRPSPKLTFDLAQDNEVGGVIIFHFATDDEAVMFRMTELSI